MRKIQKGWYLIFKKNITKNNVGMSFYAVMVRAIFTIQREEPATCIERERLLVCPKNE